MKKHIHRNEGFKACLFFFPGGDHHAFIMSWLVSVGAKKSRLIYN